MQKATDQEQSALSACLDCGAPIHGAYCQGCGQRHEPALKPLRSVLAESIADVFNLDSRLYRTLRRLVTQPGLLTTEYLTGRRTRYVPPLRLYLGISAFYFAVFLVTGSSRFFVFWTGGPNTELAPLIRLLPKLMFLMVPLFAGFLALVNRRSGHVYAAHLIFALHFHAFAFLVLPLASVLQPTLRRRAIAGDFGVIGTIALIFASAVELWVVIYLYFALRRTYVQPPLLTVIKTGVLFIGYMATLAMVGMLLLPSLRHAAFS